jgi:NitT/TauT family transport system permease protein
MTNFRSALPALAFVCLVLFVWEAGVDYFRVPELLLPAPSSVIAEMIVLAPLYLKHAGPTLTEILVGFGTAAALGTLCGLVIALSRGIGNAIYPALVAMQIMPKVAFAPLLVVWFGFGILPKLVLVALIAFFPIVINTVVALNMTSQETINLFRSMGAGPAQTFFKLRLPAALPVFFGGLKIAATFSVIGVVVAEFYSSEEGLGYLLLLQVSSGSTTNAFGSILYLTILGLVIFGAITVIERALVPPHMLKRFEDTATRQVV